MAPYRLAEFRKCVPAPNFPPSFRFDTQAVSRYPLPPWNGPDKDVRPTDTTEGWILNGERSVLIVDRSEDTREVLQTALRRRGVRTFSADHSTPGLELAQKYHPDLIVLDLEVDDSNPDAVCGPFAQQAYADRAPLVVLGSVSRRRELAPDAEFVAKPYHYGPLIRRIEELLVANP